MSDWLWVFVFQNSKGVIGWADATGKNPTGVCVFFLYHNKWEGSGQGSYKSRLLVARKQSWTTSNVAIVMASYQLHDGYCRGTPTGDMT